MSSVWKPCWACLGSGLRDSINGPIDCSWCHGNGEVRERDISGRFSSAGLPPTPTEDR